MFKIFFNRIKSTNNFEDHALAYGLMIDTGNELLAYNYLDTLSFNNSDEEEFIESQLIYNEHLRLNTIISETDMSTILTNAEKRNPYACFSQSIYYQLTDSLIEKPFIHLINNVPRSRKNIPHNFDVNIYPNPVIDDNIYLDISSNAKVEIYGISGKLYLSKNYDKGRNQINISGMNESLLLIKCVDEIGNESINKVARI